MEHLVECVPNFSEGRRPEVLGRLRAAIETAPGVRLLDQTADVDHNRSVITFAGPPTLVTEAMERAVEAATAASAMNEHHGEPPRMGAVDVIPFVPIGGTTLDDCVELARAFGKRIAERFELPVYLYAAAATRAERVRLPDIRKPQFEGLREQIALPGWEPDFGPSRLHAPAGARGAPLPHRLQHQPGDDRSRAGQADRAADPRIVGRPAQGPGARAVARRAWLRPGVDEPPRLHCDAAVAPSWGGGPAGGGPGGGGG